MKKIDRQFKDYIESHKLESRKSAYGLSRTIQNSPLAYVVPGSHNNVAIYTHTLQIPKFFTKNDRRNFEKISSQFYTIFEKTIRAYWADPAVRELFHFNPRLEQLVMHPCRYSSLVPMLRVDIFYNEETGAFKVCEFNTDGTSAMYENQMMDRFLSENNAWNALKPDVDHQELMDSWADAFLKDVYEASGNKTPSIAIADYLENAYLPELYAFEQLFKERGLKAEVVDVRDLVLKDGRLSSAKTGTEYDALYRRAVTGDVMNHYDESSALIEAFLSDAVVMVGGFQTQIIHSKAISEALFSPVLRKYFTEEENAFLDEALPLSMDFEKEQVEMVLADPSRWIIKPKEGYGAKGVYAGVDLSEKNLKKIVNDLAGGGYIVQEYIPHYRTVNIDLLAYDEFLDYSNLTGLYIYNGKFAGVYSRLSDGGIVSTQYNERTVPTLFLRNEEAGAPTEG